MLQELEAQVMELYGRADGAVEGYRLSSGLDCPQGCVHCCSSEKVEATVLELIPMACHLFRTNRAELLLKRLENEDSPAACILFRPDLAGSLGGGCSEYPHRALVCRLFGFAGNTDRNGVPRLAFCRIMKPLFPPPQGDLLRGLPIFQDYGLAATAMHPSLGGPRLFINLALKEALLKVGLMLDLEQGRMTGANPGLSLDDPFDRPLHPGKRAA